jgi:hypothetical protein
MTFESFEPELHRLSAAFARQIDELTSPGYAEAQLRDDFLNPLFRALGWDLENKAGHIQNKREVEIESRTDIAGKAKRADYLFRTDGYDRFIWEAKKPRETLGPKYAYQAKRYAWNKTLPLAILSDFEEIKIYVVGGKPHPDRPDEGLWKTWHFREFPSVAREIWNLLSRSSVAAGSIDALLDSLPKRAPAGRGKARQLYLIKPDRSRALDADFLGFLDEQRRSLGSDLLKHNPDAEIRDVSRLTEAVQHIIDRLLFLRICEDRDIDTGMRLDSIVQTWRRGHGREDTLRYKPSFPMFDGDEAGKAGSARLTDESRESLWYAIVRHFRALDRRPASHVPFFNGQIFKPHFTEILNVGDQWLCDFIDYLSDEETPYLFNEIKVEILGDVYERFLGKIVRPHGRGVTIEEKPEVRKAGGVYYTPRYIVDYIVEQTVGRLLDPILEARTFAAFEKQSHALRLLDPACGSGSFLIRCFERVCEHWQRRLTRNPDERRKELCWVDPATHDVHLTVDLKRQILRRNIHGVDIDAQAVEVTQLSLYLKMLENENRTTLERQRELFSKDTALLPPLQTNIQCGNSIIGTEFSIDPDDLLRVNAFNWSSGFKEIMRSGGFDAVVGNPPYLNIDDTWGKGDTRLEAIKLQYPHVYNDKTDILFYFIANAHRLSKNKAGFIVSRAFLEAFKANKLRGYLAVNRAVAEIVDFQNFHVFEGVGITTCIIVLEKIPSCDTLDVAKLRKPKLPSQQLRDLLKDCHVFESDRHLRESLSQDVWTFSPRDVAALNRKLDDAGQRLGNILHIGQGMQTGCNEVFGGRTLLEMNMWKVPESLFRHRAANSDIQRFNIRNRDEVLLYVEDVDSFEKLPTGAKNHLTSCSPKLKARAAFKRGNCDWWRYTWPLHKDYYKRSRLVCPFLATENRFALVDDDRFIGLTDTTVLFDDEQPESLKFILGLLNSKLLTFRFRSIGKLKGGGILEYFWNSISKLPIRRINFERAGEMAMHDSVVTLVEKMLVLTPQLRAATDDKQRRVLQHAVESTDQQIDRLVYELYGLTPEEIALVESGS